LTAVIACAIRTYLSSEGDKAPLGHGLSTWADSALQHDLRGAGPWPSGRAAWHEAERPR
jgi:hypothetical protein